MLKRILINIILAFIVCSLEVLGVAFVQIVILHNHSFYAGTFLGFIKINFLFVFLTPLFFLLFILFPYNLILLKYHHYKKKWLSLAQKMILFFIIMVIDLLIVATFFENIWTPDWLLTLKYFVAFVFYTLFLVIPLHYGVDLPEQKIKASAVKI